jgi:hypothetical protein
MGFLNCGAYHSFSLNTVKISFPFLQRLFEIMAFRCVQRQFGSWAVMLCYVNSFLVWSVYDTKQQMKIVRFSFNEFSFQLADKLTAVFLCPRLTIIDDKSADRYKMAVLQCRDKFWPIVRNTTTQSKL